MKASPKGKIVSTLVSTIASMLVLASQAVHSDEPTPVVHLRALAPHIAHQMVFSAVEDCTKRGYKVSAAVVDRNGNLAAFLRNPLSGPHTIKVSQRKAFTSATLQAATSQVTERPDLNFAPDILLIVGGVPINFGGNFYGGVAVAGASDVEVDEKCAKAGIDAVADIMEFAD
ncbi:MAG: heme-binding protein [Gammaproteobacteria bacterium]